MRAILLLLIVVGCTGDHKDNGRPDSATSRFDRSAWPRCYALRSGEWTAASGQTLAGAHVPPPVIQLDTQRVRHGVDTTRQRLAPDIPALSQPGSLAPSWTQLARDSLQLLWSSGHEGVMVTLGVDADSVSGNARTFTDHGSRAFAPVTGVRTPCAAATPG